MKILTCTLYFKRSYTIKKNIYGNDAYGFISRKLEFSKITAPIKDTQSLNFKYRVLKKMKLCSILNDVAVVVQTKPVFKPMNIDNQ